MKNKHWLILSHAFNMDGRAASQTITDKMPYLLEAGVEPVVLSAVTGIKDSRFPHYQLLPWGPSGLRFDFRHWFAKNYGRGIFYKLVTSLLSILLLPFIFIERILFGLSSQSSWAIPAFIRSYWLIRQGKVDVIFSTAGAWSAHYAGWLLKKLTGVTWIAEIHDPMVIRDNQLDDGVSLRKSRDKRFLQKLESKICSDANHIWWFTEGALDYAKKRNPQLGEKGFVVLPGATPPSIDGNHQYSNKLHICHFGSLANDRSLSPVIKMLSALFAKYPAAREQVCLDVYGAPLDENSKKAILEFSLQNSVNVWGRLEYDSSSGLTGRERVMQKMHEADVLLLLQGDYEWCAEYIPSKWYEYIWTKRPIFAVTNRNEIFDGYLASRNSYIAQTLDENSILETLNIIYLDWNGKKLRSALGEPISVSQAVQKILSRVAG
jgi:hypothetical protein